jgi:mannose-6-phosphate isomerase-like protein (cupin superfamily)
MTHTNQAIALRVRRASEIEATGDPAVAVDRYLVEGRDSGGSVALVEQILAPRMLAAPLHRHSREDEYSVVLEGRLGVFQDGEEVVATPGDIVFKPRGHWHTFWNAGDRQLRILELIAPGGLEELFRRLAEPGGEYDQATLPALAAWSSRCDRVRWCCLSGRAGSSARRRLPARRCVLRGEPIRRRRHPADSGDKRGTRALCDSQSVHRPASEWW